MTTFADQTIEVTALGFRNSKDKHQLESFPKRMVWGDREYSFADITMQYLVQKGQQLITLFDMTDGDTIYRLRLENDAWTLVGMRGSL